MDDYYLKLPPDIILDDFYDTTNYSDSNNTDDNKPNPILGLVDTLTENILLYPLLIIRRQAQINSVSHCYLLSPHSVIHVLVKLAYCQGFGWLWKGLPSTLLVNGLFKSCQLAIELGLSLNPFASKLISATLLTPLFVSSSFEIVQSSVIGYSPSIWELFNEGNFGYISRKSSNDTRLLPFRVICIPTIVYHELHSFIISFFGQKNGLEKNFNMISYNQLKKKILAHLCADILLFPLEVIVHRLYLQGTRALIDNFDSIDNVLPVISYYNDAFDCYHTIANDEGYWGFFKGFGAVILQYYLRYKVLSITRSFIN